MKMSTTYQSRKWVTLLLPVICVMIGLIKVQDIKSVIQYSANLVMVDYDVTLTGPRIAIWFNRSFRKSLGLIVFVMASLT